MVVARGRGKLFVIRERKLEGLLLREISPDSGRQILYDFSCIWNQKKKKKKSQTHRNRLEWWFLGAGGGENRYLSKGTNLKS